MGRAVPSDWETVMRIGLHGFAKIYAGFIGELVRVHADLERA